MTPQCRGASSSDSQTLIYGHSLFYRSPSHTPQTECPHICRPTSPPLPRSSPPPIHSTPPRPSPARPTPRHHYRLPPPTQCHNHEAPTTATAITPLPSLPSLPSPPPPPPPYHRRRYHSRSFPAPVATAFPVPPHRHLSFDRGRR